MQSIVDFLYMVDDMLWGTPMVVIVLGTGIFLSLRFGFSYQRKLKFNIKNTFGNMTSAGEGGIELPCGLYGACEYGRHGEYQRRCNGNRKRRPGRTCLDVGFRIFRNVYKGMRNHPWSALQRALQKLHG